MKTILELLSALTAGKSYRTSKFELDPENSSALIEYDASEEILLKHAGETNPPKKYALLAAQAKQFSAAPQILNYFLDGSRRVYKVDDIAYGKMIYPIVAGQVVAGCCRRVDKKLHAEKFSAEVVLAVPDVTNPDERKGFFPSLVTKINDRLAEKNLPVRLAKILSYKTNHNPAEKFEDRAVAKIMEHMHDTEKNLVAELVRRGKLDQKNYLVKDGSLEYRVLKGDKKFNAKNYNFVIGVSKKFNPVLAKDTAGKINPSLVAELPPLSRTPVTIFERENFHGGIKFAVWYLRLRDKKFSDSPFDGVVKVEKILVTDAEIRTEKIDSDEVNLLSAYLLNERNPVCYGEDSRWANHIYPIFLTERFVKSGFISTETFLNLF